ncbi:SDR family oxidoreductase [Pseudomonas sp. SK3(2021)]|uniref:SDR family oxidoreductase n=1 Tax=Pseudomonas sp. SK3(2021) TaxID=2841064 RepID=UPI00192CCDC8|nr:SDR family oxidoreductase [Pseudomonas sp. SK3(2021)]QQZ39627.1 SDR family oxidoreductase [Pseudomonas sp. SK3(2021)]
MMLDLTGRIALVTGSGQGIGRAIAQVFAAQGAKVLLATRSEASGAETRRLIREAGGSAELLVLDLSTRAAADQAVAATLQAFGGLDLLIHNAGVFPMESLCDLKDETLDTTLAVNLKSCFWLTRAALPALRRAEHPRIVITSSVTGPRTAIPGLAHYAASKAGVNGFIRAAALELAEHRITVNGVEPGLIATQAMANLGDGAALARGIPLKRLGSPQDIAHAMLFLASEQAGYITGQTLIVDGGALLPENTQFS